MLLNIFQIEFSNIGPKKIVCCISANVLLAQKLHFQLLNGSKKSQHCSIMVERNTKKTVYIVGTRGEIQSQNIISDFMDHPKNINR